MITLRMLRKLDLSRSWFLVLTNRSTASGIRMASPKLLNGLLILINTKIVNKTQAILVTTAIELQSTVVQ